MKGVEYLRKKLGSLRENVNERYEFYEQKATHLMPNVTIPANVSTCYHGGLGWNTTSVDLLVDRLTIVGFDYDPLLMAEIYDANNSDVLFSSAILGAVISSCDFIYIQRPNSIGEIPRMQVIDGGNATGIIDPVTFLLREGYAVLERDPETGSPVVEAYFEPYVTTIYYKEANRKEKIEHNVPYPLLVPVIHRPDSRRPFGRSRISPTCMRTQEQAEDLVTRINVLSEIASWPEKYVLGLSSETEDIDKVKATISSMLRFDKDEDGDTPTVGQFSQMQLNQHIEAFKILASNFCGETGLTMDDIGFVLSNPSSADAIKATHESLRSKARKAQSNFTIGFINAGYLAASLRNGVIFRREEAIKTIIKWQPIVEPDSTMLSSIGDGVVKMNQAIPGYFDAKALENLTGIRSAEVVGGNNGLLGDIEDILG